MTVVFACVPSAARPGRVNVFIPGPGKGWLAVDPDGNESFTPDRVDANYQQFKRTGPLTFEITPRDDQNPPAMTTFVLMP